MKNRKLIITILLILSIIILLFISYKGLVKYYECHELPRGVVMRQLQRADGKDIELFGKIISPAFDENKNITGYAEIINYCE